MHKYESLTSSSVTHLGLSSIWYKSFQVVFSFANGPEPVIKRAW